MSTKRDGECGLSRFERNQYFYGKLMTARDMQAEQEYHRKQLQTVARHVLGHGRVRGLNANVVEDKGDLKVKVQPGVALDCCGRPIVVPEERTLTVARPRNGADQIYLHLEYDQCSKESVPVPESSVGGGDRCHYNRVLETITVTSEDANGTNGPTNEKPVPKIEFPDPRSDEDDPSSLKNIAEKYHQSEARKHVSSHENHTVFLGKFVRKEGSDGIEWNEKTEGWGRSIVYDNEMLYAAIARHVLRDNPHQLTSAHVDAIERINDVRRGEDGRVLLEPGSNNGIAIGSPKDENKITFDLSKSVNEKLSKIDAIEKKVEDLSNRSPQPTQSDTSLVKRVEPLEWYVMKRTLKNKRRAFSDLARWYAVQIAGEIATKTDEAITEKRYRDETQYREFIGTETEGILEQETRLASELRGLVEEEGREEYAAACAELNTVVKDENRRSITELATAQDEICERAERLVGAVQWFSFYQYEIDTLPEYPLEWSYFKNNRVSITPINDDAAFVGMFRDWWPLVMSDPDGLSDDFDNEQPDWDRIPSLVEDSNTVYWDDFQNDLTHSIDLLREDRIYPFESPYHSFPRHLGTFAPTRRGRFGEEFFFPDHDVFIPPDEGINFPPWDVPVILPDNDLPVLIPPRPFPPIEWPPAETPTIEEPSRSDYVPELEFPMEGITITVENAISYVALEIAPLLKDTSIVVEAYDGDSKVSEETRSEPSLGMHVITMQEDRITRIVVRGKRNQGGRSPAQGVGLLLQFSAGPLSYDYDQGTDE